jgi:hypothetical protein
MRYWILIFDVAPQVTDVEKNIKRLSKKLQLFTGIGYEGDPIRVRVKLLHKGA